MRIVLTHPVPRVHQIADAVKNAGLDVLCLPFSEVSSVTQEEILAFQGLLKEDFDRFEFKNVLGVVKESDYLRVPDGDYDWVVWVSPTSVLFAPPVWPWPVATKIVALGPGTREALLSSFQSLIFAHESSFGDATISASELVEILIPSGPRFDSESLMNTDEFSPKPGQKLLVFRGIQGKNDWLYSLCEKGVLVKVFPAYSRKALWPTDFLVEQLLVWIEESVQCSSTTSPVCVFSLQDSILHFFNLLRLMESRGLIRSSYVPKKFRAIVSHPKLFDCLKENLWESVCCISPGLDALLKALLPPVRYT